jgi:ABC-type uncharacterized transport system fused permease/ATPase subunit
VLKVNQHFVQFKSTNIYANEENEMHFDINILLKQASEVPVIVISVLTAVIKYTGPLSNYTESFVRFNFWHWSFIFTF